MATIRFRGPHQYQAIIKRQGFPTQRKTFEKRTDAAAWARKIESEIERGVWKDTAAAEALSLGEALKRYLRDVTPGKRGKAQEEARINRWRAHPLAARSLAELRPADFAQYRDERLREVGPQSVRHELALISNLYTVSMREWGIEGVQNPIRSVRLPSPPAARTRRLEGDEGARLLAALDADASKQRDEGVRLTSSARNPWLRPLVEFAIETAIRQGEMLALKWADVDLKERTAHLPTTKNGEARTVPLSTRAVKVLKALPRSIGGRVFPTTADAVKKGFTRACRRAGIEGLHFHDLRHEATSRLAERLSNVLELAAVTGHKDLRMLKRYYHPRAADLARKLG